MAPSSDCSLELERLLRLFLFSATDLDRDLRLDVVCLFDLDPLVSRRSCDRLMSRSRDRWRRCDRERDLSLLER